MSIKEHFSKMLITLGWATTGGTVLYGMYFLYELMSIL